MASDMRRPSNSRWKTNDFLNGTQSKALAGKGFLLEIENRQIRVDVAECIVNAGGKIIESFDDEKPSCVVSDHPTALKLEKAKAEDPIMKSEKLLKTIPALLRTAVKSGIKVRTPQRFMENMRAFIFRKEKTMSATTSGSTVRGKMTLAQNVRRESNARLEDSTHRVVPKSTRISTDPSESREKEKQVFLRIDLPLRKPDIRFITKDSFQTVFGGTDTGYSVFKAADIPLREKREKEYDLFQKGRYQPSKKTFKFDERDNFCQFCQKKFIGERRDHERTDDHRNKARSNGLASELERIIMSNKLLLENRQKREKRNLRRAGGGIAISRSKRAGVEFEYGENEMKANWQLLKRITLENVPEAVHKKTTVLSPRRRQKRILTLSSQEDTPFI